MVGLQTVARRDVVEHAKVSARPVRHSELQQLAQVISSALADKRYSIVSRGLFQSLLKSFFFLSIGCPDRQLSIAIPKRLTIGSILQEIGSQPFLASELVRFTEGAGNKRQDWSAIDQKGEGTLENRGHGNAMNGETRGGFCRQCMRPLFPEVGNWVI